MAMSTKLKDTIIDMDKWIHEYSMINDLKDILDRHEIMGLNHIKLVDAVLKEQIINTRGMKLFKNLSPVLHETLADHYRVPIKHKEPRYSIYVKPDYKRIFLEEKLPPFIQSRLTMAKAACERILPDNELYEVGMYIYRGNGMGDVAWRASESMYIVVMDKHELNDLCGEKFY